jgi:Uma2 family endonuclease
MSTLIVSPGKAAVFSLSHYERMVQAGAFAPPYGDRIELFHGRIVEKATSAPAKFTLQQYEHMIQVGAFDPPFDIPVELLDGEIVMMSPIGEPHSLAVIALTEWSYEVVDRTRVMVRVQVPIRIPATQSEPEPDIVWVERQASGNRPPEPDRVLLLVEVADSSLSYDREVKLPNYAIAGIPEYWIVNLIDKQIEVHRNPIGRDYQYKSVYRGDAWISPLAEAKAIILPSALFD